MLLAAFQSQLPYSRPDGHGGVITYTYTYSNAVTWVVLALALAWVVWLLLRARMRARARRRPPRRKDYGPLKRVVKLKQEMSRTLLRRGFSTNIQAVGVGLLGGRFGEYCIQVFVRDANAEMWVGAGAETLPDLYRGTPVVILQLDEAGFTSEALPNESVRMDGYVGGIREPQEVIVGGLSGANMNLTGESGTIGYFCKRRSRFPRRTEICFLSNSHVLADLRKTQVDASDMIVHPSPGEAATGRPIGALLNFTALKFDGSIDNPNHVDAALAKLWDSQKHCALIPFVGAVKGHVAKREVELGEAVCKFGRTTGLTKGHVTSIYMDIRVLYDRTGQSALFENQILIEPNAPDFPVFVSKGDSGSLAMDENQNAVGLIFAGTSDIQQPRTPAPNPDPNTPADAPRRVQGYGVANPIEEVLDRLKVDLLI